MGRLIVCGGSQIYGGGEEWIDRISRRDFDLVVTTFLIRWRGMVFGSSHLALGSSFNCSSNKLTHPGRPAIIPAKLGVSVVDIVRRVDLNLRVVDKICC